jgi:hypothetical protein
VSTLRLLRLYLGLRFAGSDAGQTGRQAKKYLEEIEKLEAEQSTPVFWNFPVAPFLGQPGRSSSAAVAAIRRRVRAGGDRIVPAGFTGVPHPLLLPEELERELRWCYRNPWFPAVTNLFGVPPESILPVYPELYAESRTGAYSSHGFRTICIPIPLHRLLPTTGKNRWTVLKPLTRAGYSIPGGNSKVNLRPIAVMKPAEVTTEGIEGLLTACGRADSLALMLDLADGNQENAAAQAEVLRRLFLFLSRHRKIQPRSLPVENLESEPPEVDPGELLKFLPGVGGESKNEDWDRIEGFRRKKRKTNLQMRELLQMIAGAFPADTTGRSSRTARHESIEITNISMAGSVTLIGVDRQATFQRGLLSNLIDRGEKVLPGEAGRSVFTLDGKREHLQTESAVSFDKRGESGLRSTLCTRADRRGGSVRVILDYYFGDECAHLAVDQTIRYPPFRHGVVAEVIPLEVCLCSFTEDEPPTLTVEDPGGDPRVEALTAQPRILLSWGKVFRVRHGNRCVELLTAPGQHTRRGHIEFRVEKKRAGARGGGYLLWANLGGSYLPRPAADLPTGDLHLSYGIRFDAAVGDSSGF